MSAPGDASSICLALYSTVLQFALFPLNLHVAARSGGANAFSLNVSYDGVLTNGKANSLRALVWVGGLQVLGSPASTELEQAVGVTAAAFVPWRKRHNNEDPPLPAVTRVLTRVLGGGKAPVPPHSTLIDHACYVIARLRAT